MQDGFSDGLAGPPLEGELGVRDVFEGCLERIMPSSLVRRSKTCCELATFSPLGGFVCAGWTRSCEGEHILAVLGHDRSMAAQPNGNWESQ